MKLETVVTVTVGEMSKMSEVANLLSTLTLFIVDEGKGLEVATELWEAQQAILKTIGAIEEVTEDDRYRFALDEFVNVY